MANYRFRVTFEDHDEVSRDIEVRSTQTFEDFHFAIHNSIGFDASKPASFYMSDDNWKKGKEISNKEISEEQAGLVSLLNKARLCDFIADPHQKIYYIFDLSSPWTFHIELIKINRQEEPGAVYPRTVKTTGEAPKQYGLLTTAPPPLPEDFEGELDLEDDEEELEAETEELVIDAAEIPEGEDKGNFEVAAVAGEEAEEGFEPAEEDGMDDEAFSDNDEI
jgi:hypothetical protein